MNQEARILIVDDDEDTLLDIMLPDLEGTKLIGLFKAVHPEMAVIMITGNASLDNAMESLNNGASN